MSFTDNYLKALDKNDSYYTFKPLPSQVHAVKEMLNQYDGT